MKKNGSITVYLSLILISVIMLISVLTEATRVNTVQAKSKGYTYMAADSVLAGYAKQIYRDYGILLVWAKEPVNKQIEQYIQDNIKGADLKGTGSNFMSTEIVGVSDTGQKTVVEDGEAFVRQILSYMKYAGGIKVVESLLEKVDEYSQNNKAKEPKKSDVTYITDKNSNELQEMVKNINLKLTKIKNTKILKKKFETASQKLEKASGNEGNNKNAKAFLSAYRRLLAELDKKAGAASGAIILIKQYERKKVQFLKESGYTSDVRDYIDENLKSLEKAEDTINQIKKLGVSDFSIIDLKNTDIAKFSIKTIEEAQACLESLTIGSSTEKDKENQSIYENAKAFLTSGILSLVLQDVSDISDSAVSDTNLPTNLMTGQMENSIVEDIKNKAVLSVYADIKFGNFLKSDKDSGLRYELEYIVSGHNSDRENLKSVAEKITGIRNAVNLAYIVTDSKKMAEISTVASSAAAAIGLPFFEPIIKGVLVEAWAFAEAVNDIRELYKGNKIPFVKTAGNWRTSLKNIGRETENGYTVKKGMDYVTYLQILMLLSDEKDCVYRIMDLMQINIRARYNNDFLIADCIQDVNVKVCFKTRQVFTSLPVVVKGLSGNKAAYEYEIQCMRGY